MRQQWSIRRDDDDDRALLLRGLVRPRTRPFVTMTAGGIRRQQIGVGDAAGQVGNLLSHRNPRDSQVAARAVVALDEDTDRVAALLRRELPRCRADAALEPVAYHARPAADRAFLRQTARGAIERSEHVLGLHVKPVD